MKVSPAYLVPLIATALLLLAGCSGPEPNPQSIPQVDPRTRPTTVVHWTFDADRTGSGPQGAEALSGTWTVQAEPDAPTQPNALCQTGTAGPSVLALANTVYADAVLTARFKPVSGEQSPGGGLAFRVQDAKNYYQTLVDPRDSKVSLRKYVNGQPSTIKQGQAQIQPNQWQELRAEFVGNRLRIFLNGQAVIEVSDGTFKNGMAGLGAPAGSAICFDDAEVRSATPNG